MARIVIIRLELEVLEQCDSRGDVESTLQPCSRVFSRSLLLLERALPGRLVTICFRHIPLIALRKPINSNPG